MKLVNNLDFSKYEAQNMKLQNLATAPASPAQGQAYFDTTLDEARIWDGAIWKTMGAAGSVTAVAGTSPITSTGGSTPSIGIIPATTAVPGSMSAADKTKIDGIANAATANSSDAFLLGRANHTGTQPISSVTSLQASLDAKLDDSQLGANNGVAGLDASGDVPLAQLPYAASGVSSALLLTRSDDARLSDARTPTAHAHAQTDVTGLAASLAAKLDTSARGAANGVASLDGGGRIPSTQLPAIGLTDVSVVASIVARDALVVEEGDVAIVTATAQTFIYDGSAWQLMQTPVDGVTAVTGASPITSTGGNTPQIGIAADSITAAHLAAQAVGASELSTAVAGNGLTGGNGSALAVGAGTGISVAADTVAVDTAVVVRKAGFNIGDGVATSFTLTHNFNTRDVTVAVYLNSGTYEEVLADITHATVNTVTLAFAVAPAAAAYRGVVHG